MTTSTESNTPASPTPDGSFTPATELEENAFIRVWPELSDAVRNNSTHDPTPGATFIIVDKSYGRVLACHPGGHLLLDDITEYDPNRAIPKRWKWLCTEADNFIGFRNLAEDTFLGHNLWWTFFAHAPIQKGWEHFVLIRRRDGYCIQSPCWWWFRPLSARFDGSGIEARHPDGSLWGFVKVLE